MANEWMGNGCSSRSKWFWVPFERLWKNFEWMLLTFERHWKNFKRMMPAVQTVNEKFRMGDATSSNDKRKISNGYWKISSRWCQPFEQLKKYLEHIIPGIRTAEEKGSYWTNGENAGDLDVLIKDMFLLPFRRSIAVILITHFFISAFKTWQNLEMDTKSC